MRKIYSVIKGTGSYIPENVVKNSDFLKNTFYEQSGTKIETDIEEIVEKFVAITDIHERRHLSDDLVTSDMAAHAAEEAIKNAGIDKELLDCIIVAHNFGDISNGTTHTDALPSLASRVKEKLQIENEKTIAYDLLFGCPGWVQGMIQADQMIRCGDAKRVMVIGSDSLSRISDPHDRDSMIYADGAGATIIEAVESDEPVGILAHAVRTDTLNDAYNLWMGKSSNANFEKNDLFLKMNGRKIYEYALTKVPLIVKESLDKAGVLVENVKKILIHQANAKMDEAILKRIMRMAKGVKFPKNIMPMTIDKLGNSSVATVPTLLDFVMTGKMPGYELENGQIAVFASVGAGMNINSIVYKMPGK